MVNKPLDFKEMALNANGFYRTDPGYLEYPALTENIPWHDHYELGCCPVLADGLVETHTQTANAYLVTVSGTIKLGDDLWNYQNPDTHESDGQPLEDYPCDPSKWASHRISDVTFEILLP